MIDRAAYITVAGKSYGLLLTTRATKELSTRYGGLEKMGDVLRDESSGAADKLSEVLFMVAVLCNQCRAYQLASGEGEVQPEISLDMLEILTSPGEIAGFGPAITEAINAGMGREVPDTSKNGTAGAATA